MDGEKLTFVYILKCKHNKYYVGRTARLAQRFVEHWSGTGSNWTKLHPPITVERVIETRSNYEEGNYVREYMHMYGIDNVRGGAYVKQTLTREERALLTKEIREAKNLCMLCGSAKHFCNDCPQKSSRQASPGRNASVTRARQDSPPRRVRPDSPGRMKVQAPLPEPAARVRHRSPSPTRMAGLNWTKEEDARLLQEYKSGYDIGTLAAYHQRTQNAIRLRLESLNVQGV